MADDAQGPAGDAGEGSRVVWLDWAGGLAAVLLVVIVADIWSGGRLVSAPLWRWRNRRNGGGGDAAERPSGD